MSMILNGESVHVCKYVSKYSMVCVCDDVFALVH